MHSIHIRRATKQDASELVCLIDCAGYGMPLYVWDTIIDGESSVLEVGRKRAMREEGSFSYKNAWVAEMDGNVAGILVGYRLDDEIELDEDDKIPTVFRPLIELESEAPGTWYVNVLAVHDEYRGKGIGQKLLDQAEICAKSTNADGLSLIFESANTGARKLYEREGYRVTASRKRVPFGKDRTGSPEWILMKKDI